MTPRDFVKAAGVAVVLLILNVMVAVAVVLVYSYAIEPGHPREFYDQAALWIAPWGCYFVGTALFLIAGFVFARRQPARNGFLFALAFTAFYTLIDAATVGFVGMASAAFFLSLLLKIVASLTGAFLGARMNSLRAFAHEK
jgi:hypothetical protein